jgi:hypothetical protein
MPLQGPSRDLTQSVLARIATIDQRVPHAEVAGTPSDCLRRRFAAAHERIDSAELEGSVGSSTLIVSAGFAIMPFA